MGVPPKQGRVKQEACEVGLLCAMRWVCPIRKYTMKYLERLRGFRLDSVLLSTLHCAETKVGCG